MAVWRLRCCSNCSGALPVELQAASSPMPFASASWPWNCTWPLPWCHGGETPQTQLPWEYCCINHDARLTVQMPSRLYSVDDRPRLPSHLTEDSLACAVSAWYSCSFQLLATAEVEVDPDSLYQALHPWVCAAGIHALNAQSTLWVGQSSRVEPQSPLLCIVAWRCSEARGGCTWHRQTTRATCKPHMVSVLAWRRAHGVGCLPSSIKWSWIARKLWGPHFDHPTDWACSLTIKLVSSSCTASQP